MSLMFKSVFPSRQEVFSKANLFLAVLQCSHFQSSSETFWKCRRISGSVCSYSFLWCQVWSREISASHFGDKWWKQILNVFGALYWDYRSRPHTMQLLNAWFSIFVWDCHREEIFDNMKNPHMWTRRPSVYVHLIKSASVMAPRSQHRVAITILLWDFEVLFAWPKANGLLQLVESAFDFLVMTTTSQQQLYCSGNDEGLVYWSSIDLPDQWALLFLSYGKWNCSVFFPLWLMSTPNILQMCVSTQDPLVLVTELLILMG